MIQSTVNNNLLNQNVEGFYLFVMQPRLVCSALRWLWRIKKIMFIPGFDILFVVAVRIFTKHTHIISRETKLLLVPYRRVYQFIYIILVLLILYIMS